LNFDISKLSFLVGPIVGAIIGLITNGVAIRMLFRPLHPVKVFGWTLPFTPGIIPKEKERISKACGSVVGEFLINEEVMSDCLLSEEMDQKIMDLVDRTVENYKDSPLTLRQISANALTEERSEKLFDKSCDSLTNMIYTKAVDMNIGASVAEIAMAEVQKRSMLGSLAFLINLDSMKLKLATMVNEIVASEGRGMIAGAITSEANDIMDTTLAQINTRYNHHLPKIREVILEAYHDVVKNNLARALNAIGIATLVEDRINSFDMLELEHIILGIVKKELDAIVWLGGLLGLIMGFVMILF